MKSPFPGMDPYLERHWGDVHHRLIQYACDQVQPRLPEDLLARVEERVFVASQSGGTRPVVPDVRVSEEYPESGSAPDQMREGESAVADPIVFDMDLFELTEGYITICEADGGKIITVVEFLSPSNKRPGLGQQKYLEKQAEVLQSNASLVEIDLVRAGARVLALPEEEIPRPYRSQYLACISPGWKRRRRELYILPLRQRLLLLPIPLRPHEPRIELDLQALVDQVYAAGRYDKLDCAVPLEPVLPAEDASWADQLLRRSRSA